MVVVGRGVTWLAVMRCDTPADVGPLRLPAATLGTSHVTTRSSVCWPESERDAPLAEVTATPAPRESRPDLGLNGGRGVAKIDGRPVVVVEVEQPRDLAPEAHLPRNGHVTAM